jgi:signal transduction histidine kinase
LREVSCRVFDFKLRALRKRGLSEEVLLRGTDLSLTKIKDKRERIDWADYVRIMNNARALWSEAELIALGGAFLDNPAVRWIASVARLLFTARDFYEWATRDGAGAADSLFSCIRTSFRELGPGRLELELRLVDGHAYCREFFLVTQGAFAAYPRVLGLPPARVKMLPTERGARYEIEYPEGGGRLSWLRKSLSLPLAARSVAQELKQAHVDLQARYRELERAQGVLDEQARQLRTAHRINQLIRVELDLDRTLEACGRALIEVGGLSAVSVSISVEIEGRNVTRHVTSGAHPNAGTPLRTSLDAGGRVFGELVAWPSSDKPDGASAILELVTPAIAVAISDALAYGAVQDYRANLELKVKERTQELLVARDQLAQTVAELERAQAARDRIFANINHEIRTPLTNVVLAVKELERQAARLDLGTVRTLSSIQFNANRMLRLIDGLLLLAARREGKLEIEPVDFDLAEMLREIVNGWEPTAEVHGIGLQLEAPDHAPVRLDPAAIEQVVTNLVSNAIKFTPRGGRVIVHLEREAREVRLAVIDSGTGMDDAFLSRIFGRFEQGDAPVHNGRSGSGIGLAIARELVEAHHGRITAESAKGKGSRFTVTIPIEGVAIERPAPKPPTLRLPAGFTPEPLPSIPAGPQSSSRTSKSTLLIAEDDPELLRYLGTMFQRDHRVLLAPSGEHGLELAKEHSPDLLISDLEMPGMNGLDLTERFRALPGLRIAPVILLTAHGDLERRMAGFNAGAIDYVTKPFAPSELAARVRAQLAIRDLALQLHENEKLASLGLLLAGMAHELRNPANGLLNALPPLKRLLPKELLENGNATAKLLDVLDTCARQVATLSRNLLNLGTDGELIKEDTDLPSLLRSAERLVQGAFASGVELRKLRVYAGPVRCAAALVVQVLANLLENGAHAAGPRGWVAVDGWASDAKLVVEVFDSGPGVPEPLRERIFDPFFTTKPPGQGTGLGLTNARRIAMRHGGTLEVRIAREGTVFHLEIPLGREAELELGGRS